MRSVFRYDKRTRKVDTEPLFTQLSANNFVLLLFFIRILHINQFEHIAFSMNYDRIGQEFGIAQSRLAQLHLASLTLVLTTLSTTIKDFFKFF